MHKLTPTEKLLIGLVLVLTNSVIIISWILFAIASNLLQVDWLKYCWVATPVVYLFYGLSYVNSNILKVHNEINSSK